MKKYFTLVGMVLSLLGFSNTGFRFSDSTAQWNVLSRYWCMTGPCHYYNTLKHEVNGDTLIEGMYYQSVDVAEDTSWFNMTNLGARVFLRKDASEKIFLRRAVDSLDYLIYDFSKQAGDTFTIENPDFWNVCYCTVDSVDTVLLDNPRKRMYVRYNGNWNQDIWIEGIGSVKSHFLQPGTNYIVSDGADYEMLCYLENTKQIYRNPTFQTCSIDSVWMGVAELGAQTFALSPNPATSRVTIQINDTRFASSVFHLFDVAGRMILQQPLTAAANHIELNGVSKGMYLYNVFTEGEKAGAGKLIIE
jgi:hypothetical protein